MTMRKSFQHFFAYIRLHVTMRKWKKFFHCLVTVRVQIGWHACPKKGGSEFPFWDTVLFYIMDKPLLCAFGARVNAGGFA